LNSVAGLLHTETLIVVDSGLGLAFEIVVHQCLPLHTAVSVFCDVEVNFMGDSTFSPKKEKYELLFGYSVFETYKSGGIDICEYSKLANTYLSKEESSLNDICRLVKTIGDFKIDKDINKDRLISRIWLNLIRAITGEILPIIFDDFDFNNLLSDSSIKLILKGVVAELIYISMNFGIRDFRLYLGELFGSSSIEVLIRHISKTLRTEKRSPSSGTLSASYTKLQTDFVYNLENYCFVILYQAIMVSDNLGIPNPNLTFLYGMLKRLSNLESSPIWIQRPSKLVISTVLRTARSASLPIAYPLIGNESEKNKEIFEKDKHNAKDVLKIKNNGSDDDAMYVCQDLADLYVDPEILGESVQQKLQIDRPRAQTIIDKNNTGAHCMTLSPESLEYEEKDRDDMIPDIGMMISDDHSSESSRTEDGIDTIVNEATLKDFQLPDVLKRPQSAQPKLTNRMNHRRPFTHVGRRAKKRSKSSERIPPDLKYQHKNLQKAEFLSYKDYGFRHLSIFDSIGGNFEEGNRDRYGNVASSSKSSKPS
jgi:hypothetical protein